MTRGLSEPLEKLTQGAGSDDNLTYAMNLWAQGMCERDACILAAYIQGLIKVQLMPIAPQTWDLKKTLVQMSEFKEENLESAISFKKGVPEGEANYCWGCHDFDMEEVVSDCKDLILDLQGFCLDCLRDGKDIRRSTCRCHPTL